MYGHSKLAGETAIRDSGCNHFIVRTSWVYAARGQNFVRTILRLAAERESLSVINDQIGAPTFAGFLAHSTAKMIDFDRANASARAKHLGTYHVTARGEASWHTLASYVVQCALDCGAPFKSHPHALPQYRLHSIRCPRLALAIPECAWTNSKVTSASCAPIGARIVEAL